MELYGFPNFHPQWLHFRLSANADYRMRFADRAFRLLQPGNPLSPEACLSRFNRRTAEIMEAVVAESARWGDTDRSFAYTRDDAWILEIEEVRNDFIPFRSDILLNQLRGEGLFPSLDAPVIRMSGTEIHTAWVEFKQGTTVSVSRPGQSGTIFYTLYNSDPRSPNGQINPAARSSAQTVTLSLTTTTPVKARIYWNGTWSALNHINFLCQTDDYSSLKVTELMYHPPDRVDGADTVPGISLEFIEFKNTGSTFLNLSEFRLDSAVQATFPQNTLAGPGQFLVAASKPFAFSSLYGIEPTVNYSGNFSNNRENVLLADPQGNAVISFAYLTDAPWPQLPDGKGHSLTAGDPDPVGDPNDAGYWRSSAVENGSPFADDEGLPSTYPEAEAEVLSVYPNPATSWLMVDLQIHEGAEPASLALYDLQDSMVYAETFRSHTRIDLEGKKLKPGVYVLKVWAGTLLTRKVVFTPADRP